MNRREFTSRLGASAAALMSFGAGACAAPGARPSAGPETGNAAHGAGAPGEPVAAYRTPEADFAALPGYDFPPSYIGTLEGYPGLRMHYLDLGPREAEHTFLCLHGQPSWSYLYRKMIPVFLDSGARVIAPDWFGFGRSDKPINDAVYSFHFHRDAMMAFIEALDLRNITLVCQDWGGVLGLTIPMDMPGRFSRLIVMNTDIAVGEPMPPGFKRWQARAAGDLDVKAFFANAVPILSEAEAEAYAAPFPVYAAKAGVRTFPSLVPESPDAPGAALGRRAREWWRTSWTGESFMAVGAQDRLLGPQRMERLRQDIRNCPPFMLVEEGGHFVQEWGEPIAREALKRFGDI